jgi:hypothetical protein
MDGKWGKWWVILLLPIVLVQAAWNRLTGPWQRRRKT